MSSIPERERCSATCGTARCELPERHNSPHENNECGRLTWEPAYVGDLRRALDDSGECPVCCGAGEVQYSTTPNIDPRDPFCETREDPCGECDGTGEVRVSHEHI